MCFRRNVGTGGMCSKCFRETAAQQEKSKAAEEALRAAANPVEQQPATPLVQPSAVPEEAPVASSSSPAPEVAPESVSKGPTRCQQCRKKVGLTGFKCKCGLMFCGQHRYAEAHSCGFDYKETGRAKLAESNPLVQASKVQRF